MKHRIAIVVLYFGHWPEWINFFIETCRTNPTIDWIIIGDARPPESRARNVHHVTTSFDDYRQLLSSRLGLKVAAENPYKLCDLRPALGDIHRDLLSRYDFVGFGDLDVVYGDLRSFWRAELLNRFDLFSSHVGRVSGHLCLMRNSDEVITAYRNVKGWERAATSPEHSGFDERDFYNHIVGRGRVFSGSPRLNGYFNEAYSTPAATDHMRWFWRDGALTNEFYPQHPFMYLHFMNWHSDRWIDPQSERQAPWTKLDAVVQCDWTIAGDRGFMISPAGIEAINDQD